MLTRAGYSVVTATEGWEALELFQESPTLLVITDLLMPNMQGTDFIRRLQDYSPKPKIIARSGGGFMSSTNLLDAASDCGADAAFPKPLDRDAFLETVARLLK